jgi:deoxyribonuclease V
VWPRTIPEARVVQDDIRKRVLLTRPRRRFRTIAGCDVSVEQEVGRVFAAVVVMTWPGLERAETSTAVGTADFPYVPGYLSFREGPLLDEAFRALEAKPDVILVDGQGYAHPRRCGLACHLGVMWDVPSVGCAKSRLVGEAEEPGRRKGDWAPLVDRGEVVGSVLRTRDDVKPVFVSPGHRMDQDGARELVLESVTRYRLPEPIRRAHGEVNALRRSWMSRHDPGGARRGVKRGGR